MANLQMVLSEVVKLNRNISQFLKFSTYTDHDDLRGLDIDRKRVRKLLQSQLICQLGRLKLISDIFRSLFLFFPIVST